MVEDNNGRLKTELLAATLELCDKIDRDYKEIIKNIDAPLGKVFKECKKLASYIDNKKTDLILLHAQIKEKTAGSLSEIMREIIKHESKVINLLCQTQKITQKSACSQCKNKLSNNPYIYFLLENKAQE